MLWYKIWLESRVRFLLSAVLIGGMCLMYTLLRSKLMPGVMHDTPRVHNYIQYIHWTIYGGATRGILQLSCLLLGLGGLQRDRKQNTLGFTLALPVSRIRTVMTRATAGFAQVLALSLLPPFLITGASYLMHEPMPLAYGLRFVPLWGIGGFFTLSLAFLFSVVFASEYVSLAVAYVTYILYLAGAGHPWMSPYHLHVADFMSGFGSGALDRATMLWGNRYPVTQMVGFFAAGVVLIVASGFITTRQDL
jgi:ABC-2 type transport system permease protein